MPFTQILLVLCVVPVFTRPLIGSPINSSTEKIGAELHQCAGS